MEVMTNSTTSVDSSQVFFCQNCGEPFKRCPRDVKAGKTRFCKWACYVIARKLGKYVSPPVVCRAWAEWELEMLRQYDGKKGSMKVLMTQLDRRSRYSVSKKLQSMGLVKGRVKYPPLDEGQIKWLEENAAQSWTNLAKKLGCSEGHVRYLFDTLKIRRKSHKNYNPNQFAKLFGMSRNKVLSLIRRGMLLVEKAEQSGGQETFIIPLRRIRLFAMNYRNYYRLTDITDQATFLSIIFDVGKRWL